MAERTNLEWWEALNSAAADAALADLRVILLRGLRYGLAGRGVTEADLEDFAQDALLKVLRELASFRGEARFTTWAQKVAVRVALTDLRRRRWRDVSLHDLLAQPEDSDFTPAALTDPAPDPGQIAVRRAMLEKVGQLMAVALTERQRTALMAVMHGMSLQEVALRLGTNRNALYKLLHDARQRLQKTMQREDLSADELLAMFDEG